LRAEARIRFDVPPAAFTPAPKVMSSVVSITPRTNAPSFPMRLLEMTTQAAFGQRRKMLRQALKPLGDVAELLAAAEIAPERRAEEVEPEGFLRVVRVLEQREPAKG